MMRQMIEQLCSREWRRGVPMVRQEHTRKKTSRGLWTAMAALCRPLLLGIGIVMALALPAVAETLQAAVAAGHVKVTFTGTGGSSGDAVMMTVTKTTSAPKGELTLTLPAGSRLSNARASEQDMVVGAVRGRMVGREQFSPVATIKLRGMEPVTYVLDAYCADFEKDNPSESTSFALTPPEPVLACLLKETQDLSVATRQAAVWMRVDRITFTHMNEKLSVTRTEWAEAEKAMTRCQGDTSRP